MGTGFFSLVGQILELGVAPRAFKMPRRFFLRHRVRQNKAEEEDSKPRATEINSLQILLAEAVLERDQKRKQTSFLLFWAPPMICSVPR